MYGEDLAWIHEAGFGDFASRAAPEILAILRASGIEGGRVVELGCGGGRLAEALVGAGYEVLGFDGSRHMVAMARRRAPSAEFRAVPLEQARLPRCDAVVAIGECLNYLTSRELQSPEERRQDRSRRDSRRRGSRGARLERLFGRVWEALRPGGLFVFDVREPGALERSPMRDFRAGEGWAVLVEAREEASLLVRVITTFRRVGEHYRRRTETHVLELLEDGRLAERLRDHGFRVHG